MAVSKQKKVEILASLVEQVKNAKSIWFASSSRVTVEEFSTLRKNLRDVDATYTLAKKTLIKRAIKEALDMDIDLADLEWQIGIICSNWDAIAWLAKVNDFIKANPKDPKIAWAASIFEGKFQTKDETKVLASMPSRETLLSRLVGSMKSPISSLARFFDAAAKDLEAQGKAKVSELKVEKAPEVKEEPKKEEVKTEEPKVEEKVEAPVETPEVKAEETPATEEVKTEEAPATEEVKEEKAAE